MIDLVPIKVRIGLKQDGSAKYPNFNQLNEVKSKIIDWSTYIDAFGSGWLYDDCGHKEEEVRNNEWDSPRNQQWGIILVPKAFADEAVSVFPSEVEKMDENRLQSFYDNYHARKFPEVNVDENALKIYEIKDKFKIPLTSEEEIKKTKALDPDNPEPGLNKNPNKKWVDYKADKGINIIQ